MPLKPVVPEVGPKDSLATPHLGPHVWLLYLGYAAMEFQFSKIIAKTCRQKNYNSQQALAGGGGSVCVQQRRKSKILKLDTLLFFKVPENSNLLHNLFEVSFG